VTVAVQIEHVSKRFRKHSEPAKTLKERLLTLHKSTVEDFHALNDIDFEVYAGETFGILGHNGSGKSTLLKCIAGTIQPSQGVIRVRGQLSALLELGAGFHPDLTGRENIFLNGSILGFSRTKVEEIFDDIVDFSGLEEFVDTQVKHYSSGMYARLGFAVAVNLEPDVLLIDEVLAVGDEAFQRKCIERVRGFQHDGRTICLVTHSPEMVRNLCDRALVLDHGNLLHVGDVGDAVTIYRRSLDPNFHDGDGAGGSLHEGQSSSGDSETPTPATATNGDPNGSADSDEERQRLVLDLMGDKAPVTITRSWIDGPSDGRTAFRPGDQVVIGMSFKAPEGTMVRARLSLHSHDGVHLVSISSWDIRGADVGPTSADNNIARFVLDDLPLLDGHYLVTLILQSPEETMEYDRREQQLSFDVHSGQPVHGRVVMDIALETTTDSEVPTADEAPDAAMPSPSTSGSPSIAT